MPGSATRGDGCRVHDRTAAGLEHLADLVLHAEEHAQQIEREDVVERVVRHLRERQRGRQDAGVVEGAVQATEARDGRVHQCRDVGGLAHVGALVECLAAGLDDLAHGILGARASTSPIATLRAREGQRGRPADSGGSPGDEHACPCNPADAAHAPPRWR
jgi:hypothetical protein